MAEKQASRRTSSHLYRQKTRGNRGFYLVTRDRFGRTVGIHRGCWEAYHGRIPMGHLIHHKNDDPEDNRIENLECLSGTQHYWVHKGLAKEVV